MFFEIKDTEIKCPVCNTPLLKVHGARSKVYKIKCKHCRKWIWANPANGYREVKSVPTRTTASGMRFY